MAVLLFSILAFIVYIGQCKTPKEDRMLRIKFEFDETLPRLDNFGLPAAVPEGHAGQMPQFGNMSVHWIELVENYWTPIGNGTVIYSGDQTSEGVIDHSKAIIAEAGEYWLSIPLTDITPGTYPYLRTSVAYQAYTAEFNLVNNMDAWVQNTYNGYSAGIKTTESGTGYVQSFLGFETYIGTIQNQGLELEVNAEKLQGFWTFTEIFENAVLNGDTYNDRTIKWGDGTPGATTVPNPFWQSVETPQGSCVVQGEIPDGGLVIPGAPANNDDDEPDISLTLRYSVNQSLEWIDRNGNGELDWYLIVDEDNPIWTTDTEAIANQSDVIVDMGTRGLWPYVEDLDREYYTDDDGSTTLEPVDPTSDVKRFGIMGVCIALWLNLLNMFI